MCVRTSQSISIGKLAEVAELSVFHFSRVFKQATGMTPLQFVTRERVLQAQQLIHAKRPAASSKSRWKSATRVRAISLSISADGGHGSYAVPQRPLKAKERIAFQQEYDRGRTIPRAAAWSMADGLAEPQ